MGDSPLVRARRSKSSTPLVSNGVSFSNDTPRTPAHNHLQQKGDTPFTPTVDASFRNDDKVSPMLAKLRMTPGRLLKEKQTILVRKHEEAKRKVDSLNVGGGVSIWPEMDSMRMTKEEVYRLTILSVLLCASVIGIFLLLHGVTLSKLLEFQRRLQKFSKQHTIVVDVKQSELDKSVINWHNNYKQLVDSIHAAFDVSNVPIRYLVYMLLYGATLTILFYYLIDNMFAKSKLSPKRIKRWVSLLVLTMTWTLLIAVTFVIALQTEIAIETNIYNLSDRLADIIPSSLSCDKFHQVLEYWRTRCLPPTTHGTISIFGIVPVRDVTFYLQYYSIPIVTVLFTPVFRVLIAVLTVYNSNTAGQCS